MQIRGEIQKNPSLRNLQISKFFKIILKRSEFRRRKFPISTGIRWKCPKWPQTSPNVPIHGEIQKKNHILQN